MTGFELSIVRRLTLRAIHLYTVITSFQEKALIATLCARYDESQGWLEFTWRKLQS
jgi:hypothetical protein